MTFLNHQAAHLQDRPYCTIPFIAHIKLVRQSLEDDIVLYMLVVMVLKLMALSNRFPQHHTVYFLYDFLRKC